MEVSKKSILITGCSDGSLGSALALAFNTAGWRVFASARNLKKLSETEAAGIESIELDVVSANSIKSAVARVTQLTGGSLNALVNNAGAGYCMPYLDMDMQKVRELFELNVFSNISMIQAFTPLLIAASPGALIINHSSIAGTVGVPVQSAYNASKAAAAMFTSCLRMELNALGITVIDLKTGAVSSNFGVNQFAAASEYTLPKSSYYNIAKDAIEKYIGGDFVKEGSDRHLWAKQVVQDISRKDPTYQSWRGSHARFAWLLSFLYAPLFDSSFKEKTGLNIFEKRLKEQTGGALPQTDPHEVKS